MVRCVMTVSQITEHPNWWKRRSEFKGNAKTIQLSGLSADNKAIPEDLREDAKKFYDASPSIECKMSTVNPDAAAAFDVDGIYEVTFRRIGTLERPE